MCLWPICEHPHFFLSNEVQLNSSNPSTTTKNNNNNLNNLNNKQILLQPLLGILNFKC